MKQATLIVLALSVLLFGGAVCESQEMPQMPAPQKEHEWLQRLAGQWESDAEATFGPDQPPMKCKGTQRARMLGGFWLIAEGKAEMMGVPVESVLTLGFDAAKQKYVGTWTDSHYNHLWIYEGELDDDGNVLALSTEGPNPMLAGKISKFRDVIEFQSDDHYIFKSMMQGDDGEWQTFMTAHFRRTQTSGGEQN